MEDSPNTSQGALHDDDLVLDSANVGDVEDGVFEYSQCGFPGLKILITTSRCNLHPIFKDSGVTC